MGQDYSYTQPSSSSNSVDITSLLEAECHLYADEAETSRWNAEAIHNKPQPEGDDGMQTTCFCGAVMEEMRDFQRELRQLKGQLLESEQKLLILEKNVSEFPKKKAWLVLLILLGLVLLILLGIHGKGSKGSGGHGQFM